MKRVFIKTYGCQMNVRDSEALAALLEQRGYALVESESDADVILLNTCSIRDLAEQKALGRMGALARWKNGKRPLVLGFMGCMAQVRGAELRRRLPAVDLVVGTQRFHHIPEYLDRLLAGGGPVVDVAEEAGSESVVKDHLDSGAVTAFVSIMQGCDMHCSFCIVPQARGAERSRPIAEIVEEVQQLVSRGVREVTLLGQIVTSYGRGLIPKKGGRSPFVQLLEALHEVRGLERIRFTSPHPRGFGDDLIAAYRDLPKLCEHAHLPVQSGSDRILRAMRRGYDRAMFLRIVEKLRAAQPKIVFSSDIIVGFPGETEEDFEQTEQLLRLVPFEQAYIFKYSKRRGTPAAEMTDQVPTVVKEKRNRRLLAVLNEVAAERNRALIGQTVEVLVEGPSPKNPKRCFGRTRSNKGVVFEGDLRHKGALLPVRVERATAVTLYGAVTIAES
ncbi:MAG: tRNA (N6-isopentenyl adenosine(37)-C2)-methylthiotransferase MiaB [Verrucomicrobiae bacterium]|nr:tRNA (N6-isopentenyl adenosine(37)-C2)-methylthiotransferase MiaB [Verrucomicrobiae bacterium]